MNIVREFTKALTILDNNLKKDLLETGVRVFPQTVISVRETEVIIGDERVRNFSEIGHTPEITLSAGSMRVSDFRVYSPELGVVRQLNIVGSIQENWAEVMNVVVEYTTIAQLMFEEYKKLKQKQN
jgi:hypothetical protein